MLRVFDGAASSWHRRTCEVFGQVTDVARRKGARDSVHRLSRVVALAALEERELPGEVIAPLPGQPGSVARAHETGPMAGGTAESGDSPLASGDRSRLRPEGHVRTRALPRVVVREPMQLRIREIDRLLVHHRVGSRAIGKRLKLLQQVGFG